MKKCIVCGKINTDDRRLFCEECGGPLALVKDMSAENFPESTDENNGDDGWNSRESSSKTDDEESEIVGQSGNSNIKRNVLIASSVCMMICALVLIFHNFSFLSEKQDEKIVADTSSELSGTKDATSQPDLSGSDKETGVAAGTGEMGESKDVIENSDEKKEVVVSMQSDTMEVESSPVPITDEYLDQVYEAYDAFFEVDYRSVTEYTPDEWALVDLDGDGVPEILFKENSESMHGTFEVCYYDPQTGSVESAGTFYEEYYEAVMYCAKKHLLAVDGSKASLSIWRGYSYDSHSMFIVQ